MGSCASKLLNNDHWAPVLFDKSASNKDLELKWMMDCLLKTPAFLDFSDRRVEEILNVMCDPTKNNERTIQTGEYLCKIKDKSDCFWYVRRGEISVISADGTKVATKNKGDLTGEIGMIQNVDRTATLRAQKVSTIIRIQKEDYEKISSRQKELEESASYDAMMKTRLFIGWDKRSTMNVLDIMRGRIPEKSAVDKNGQVRTIPARDKTDEERALPPNHVIMRKGEKPHPAINIKGQKPEPATDFMYIVEKGTCLAITDDEPRVMFTNVFPKPIGTFFGDKALLNDSVRNATVETGPEGATLLMINKQDFSKYFMKDKSRFEYNIIMLERIAAAAQSDKKGLNAKTVEERRGETSKRMSIRAGDLSDLLEGKRLSRQSIQSPGISPTPSDNTTREQDQSSMTESKDSIADVLLDPTRWLDWVPGITQCPGPSRMKDNEI